MKDIEGKSQLFYIRNDSIQLELNVTWNSSTPEVTSTEELKGKWTKLGEEGKTSRRSLLFNLHLEPSERHV